MVDLPIYLLFAAIPFWHLRPAQVVSVYEIAIAINLFFLPWYLARVRMRWNRMDMFVYLFAFYGVVSVAIGSMSAYESMRIYRHMVLGPTLLYFIIRVLQLNQHKLARGLILFSVGVALQSLVLIHYVITHGVRPVGDLWKAYRYHGIVGGIVTFSMLTVMAASVVLYLGWRARGLKRLSLFLIGFICVFGLIASATRASAFGFLLLFPSSGWFLRRTFRRKLLVVWGYVVLAGVGVSISLISISGSYVGLGGGGENRRAIERVIDIDEYKVDVLGRVAFWETLVKQGASSPLFGKGMASFDIGTVGEIGFHVGSAHNVLVSTFYTSGLIGLIIILLLWGTAFHSICHLNFEVPHERWRACFLTVSIMVLLLVSVTNDLTAGRGNLWFLLLALLNDGQPATSS